MNPLVERSGEGGGVAPEVAVFVWACVARYYDHWLSLSWSGFQFRLGLAFGHRVG